MFKAYGKFWKKYIDFESKSSVADYWWVFLINAIINVIGITAVSVLVVMMIFPILFGEVIVYGDFSYSSPFMIVIISISLLWTLYELATLVPRIAITVRRLRDAGYPWGLVFISIFSGILGIIPIIGSFLILAARVTMIVLLVQPTKKIEVKDEPETEEQIKE